MDSARLRRLETLGKLLNGSGAVCLSPSPLVGLIDPFLFPPAETHHGSADVDLLRCTALCRAAA